MRWAAANAVFGLALIVGCGDDAPPLSPGGSTGAGASSSGRDPLTTSGAPLDSGSDGTATGTGAGNSLPPAPELTSPADGASDQAQQLELCWEPVQDPDGDPVRYRVFVDDIELTEGRLGEDDGFEGPCTPLLAFDYEQGYEWSVEAFEAEDPTRTSERSQVWSFTIEDDGTSVTVFTDSFDEDLGWTVSGDATSGAWVRGDPQPTNDGLSLSQPGRCFGGAACYYTAKNAGGVPDDEDVAGGATVLTSPPFDLTGAAAVTVEVTRFFYKSGTEAEPSLSLELLIPDDQAPGGVAVHALELLDEPTATTPENLWTPREYVVCGAPMVAGSQLRITAADDGAGVLEAAIDAVSVRAQLEGTVCGTGEGGRCEPAQGDMACPDALLCCSQGSLNAGVYRCQTPVAGLDFDAPTASPRDPNDGPLGCDAADLLIDPAYVEPVLTDIFVSDATCELLEGCVGGTGTRTLLRFAAAIPNIGSRDLVLGVAANNPDVFHYSECHDHHHFDDFAAYELRDGDTVVAAGHKQAFCLLDSTSWAWENEPGKYNCANQGISRGFLDIYEAELPCQWIDVTGVAPGDYTVRAELNPVRADSALPRINERSYDNNLLEFSVSIP
ncbi:MAG: lysyl oxidase family protein [Myxococcota bacterium]